jgi:glutamate dehydrogenase
MTANTTSTLSKAFDARLIEGALPGELEGFAPADRAAAAVFVAEAAARRLPGTPVIVLEALPGDAHTRRMRLAVINDDMPFLVDSIAATIAAHDVAVDRIIHPLLPVTRDAEGALVAIGDGPRESMIYIELRRADARARRAIEAELARNLGHVRSAVADWPALKDAMRRDAAILREGGITEGAALLDWFREGAMTLLGHHVWRGGETTEKALGIARHRFDVPLLADASHVLALDWFRNGGAAPLLLKSNCISTVHRRAPLDLIVMPVREGGEVTGLSLHAGLWTSAALNTSPTEVPILREQLRAIEAKYGFDPRSHTGKALIHALTSLPHDLTTAFQPDALERLALTAMSLADRPRPKLAMVRSTLGRHRFAFVWLPRDEVTTARRIAIGEMLAEAAGASILNWSIALEGGLVALIRYTLDVRGSAREPDVAALDDAIERMVRGWATAIEAALAGEVSDARATRLTLKFANSFPNSYRITSTPEEAARDILRLAELADDAARAVRISHDPAARPGEMRVKLYRLGGPLPLSDAVPVFENFGFRVIEEVPTALTDDARAYVHDFGVTLNGGVLRGDLRTLEHAIDAVLEGRAENDAFNRLVVEAGMEPRAVTLLRAWFRYLRQTGMSYGLVTVVDALRRAPDVATAIIERFAAAHDPALAGDDTVAAADAAIDSGLLKVAAIDDDRILRAIRAVVVATLRTNAFAPAGEVALAFKLDSGRVPGLPKPLPWREIWVYSPRVEGIHLRAGPVARGGLRWSDRRDDFRTEILGLMKAQRVKNAVIVPTGAKGGFYPKLLPSPSDRDAWLAEGTESYRIFIRTLLSITDNIVDGRVVHPDGVTILDDEDPYFVVAADKGTATFSDVANALAIERNFWLGDAFASGGSVGYDHKAMGITARGGWISVQRHFAEMGIDVQTQPITVVGCGDMSGDVFGNGMLLSKAIKLVAAFDHRHIFLDPNPDPATSWDERARLFALPRSSWTDYERSLISEGGGVFARTDKTIALSAPAAAALGLTAGDYEPAQLISEILKAPADLIWFGGIGTYVKAAAENNVQVGDPANDRLRVDAEQLRARAIGEGANLGVTQAARIAFAAKGGRVNTDFIDNSAGVDCSDNEVNIKIALNREMTEGRLSYEDRNTLLASMTDDVAHLVLEDNRLQTLALSTMENDGAIAVPSYVRVIEMLEASGRLDRKVEGLAPNVELLRRAQEGRGLTRPELAVLLATAKLALQDAVEARGLGEDETLRVDLHAAFPAAMQARFPQAIDQHRLRPQIVATKLANRLINRVGVLHPFELAEEEGVALGDIAAMFVAVERIFRLPELWAEIEAADIPEGARIALFDEVAAGARAQIADLLRAALPGEGPGEIVARLSAGVEALDRQSKDLLKDEARAESDRIAMLLEAAGAPKPLVAKVVRLFEMDGAIGLADLAQRSGVEETGLTHAFTHLGQALGLDWAQTVSARISTGDPWERLLIAGLARDFQQLRLDFLARLDAKDPHAAVVAWLEANRPRVNQFADLIRRARMAAVPNAAMLAQIAGQARVLLGR